MKTTQEPNVTGHEYDGISEYDNPTPGWWHILFFGSILFSVFYIVFWHFSPLSWTVHEAWEKDQVNDYKRIFGTVGDLKPDQETIVKMAGDQQMLSVARSIFVGNCALCHGREGGGINGVNLTDDAYKNVKTVEDLYTVISKGANMGAMPAWEQKLSKNERVILASYLMTLRGKNVPGRAPEGDVIPPFPAVPGVGR
ncbi:MAG: c-type cytochrome [Phycisphaeraceae bacterium]|nr:c-type cytochrome [Phycisphaeraceae bacterium]